MTPPQELTEAEKRERILEEYKDRGDPPQGFADWYEYHQWKYDPEGGWSEEYKEQLAGASQGSADDAEDIFGVDSSGTGTTSGSGSGTTSGSGSGTTSGSGSGTTPTTSDDLDPFGFPLSLYEQDKEAHTTMRMKRTKILKEAIGEEAYNLGLGRDPVSLEQFSSVEIILL